MPPTPPEGTPAPSPTPEAAATPMPVNSSSSESAQAKDSKLLSDQGAAEPEGGAGTVASQTVGTPRVPEAPAMITSVPSAETGTPAWKGPTFETPKDAPLPPEGDSSSSGAMNKLKTGSRIVSSNDQGYGAGRGEYPHTDLLSHGEKQRTEAAFRAKQAATQEATAPPAVAETKPKGVFARIRGIFSK